MVIKLNERKFSSLIKRMVKESLSRINEQNESVPSFEEFKAYCNKNDGYNTFYGRDDVVKAIYNYVCKKYLRPGCSVNFFELADRFVKLDADIDNRFDEEDEEFWDNDIVPMFSRFTYPGY